MEALLIILSAGLLLLITFQVAKAKEYVTIIKGEDFVRKKTNNATARLFLLFLIAGLIGIVYCDVKLKDKTLGEAASVQGQKIDNLLGITIAVTGFVFIVTQVLLFWFAYKYRESDKRQASYITRNDKLEIAWTTITAAVLTVLIVIGLYHWFKITGDAPADSMKVEVIGSQFKWEFRYPGKDNEFGKKYYRAIDPANNNPLGQLWDDPFNRDDIVTVDMHVVVGKPVKLIIGSKDVIHDVGLPQFRLKMDAVPGLPTTMWFTPRFTTKEMAQKTGDSSFVYEIACDQLCGKGHFGMRGEIIVETQEEFDKWIMSKRPQYVIADSVSGIRLNRAHVDTRIREEVE